MSVKYENLSKAETADPQKTETGLNIPAEIKRRENRINSLKKAREVIEHRFEEAKAEKQAEYEEKKAMRGKQRKNGRKPRKTESKPPKDITKDSEQYNFTDPESRMSGLKVRQAARDYN